MHSALRVITRVSGRPAPLTAHLLPLGADKKAPAGTAQLVLPPAPARHRLVRLPVCMAGASRVADVVDGDKPVPHDASPKREVHLHRSQRQASDTPGPERAFLIFNPIAGQGALDAELGAIALRLSAAFASGLTVLQTRPDAPAEALARRALQQGADLVVVRCVHSRQGSAALDGCNSCWRDYCRRQRQRRSHRSFPGRALARGCSLSPGHAPSPASKLAAHPATGRGVPPLLQRRRRDGDCCGRRAARQCSPHGHCAPRHSQR
jgi:hypothetical protein